MKILAIETSCDETALSIVNIDESDTNNPIFNEVVGFINSQAELHAEFGGVFPNLAKREHSKNFLPVLENLLKDQQKNNVLVDESILNQAKEILEKYPEQTDSLINFAKDNKPSDIDYIVVTQGPGLAPALWVGITFARVLSLIWNIPMVGVNHMEGHIVSVLGKGSDNSPVDLPALALLISGGHTQLVEIADWGNYSILGETQDDALGEAYDKVARMLGLPYPGGPEVSRRARLLREQGISSDFEFPRPMINTKNHAFSFSGLKTSVLYKIQDLQKESAELGEEIINQICLAFEDAITDVLIKKLDYALSEVDAKSLIIGGGVIANQHLRNTLTKFSEDKGLKIYIPATDHTTDNAVMIAIAGYFTIQRSEPSIAPDIQAKSNMSL